MNDVENTATERTRGTGSRRQRRSASSIARTVTTIVAGLLMLALVAVATASMIAPKFLDATPIAVTSDSMEPALSRGDVAVIREVDPQTIRLDDVVTFQPKSGDPTLVTHRVVAVRWGSDHIVEFTTRGDANSEDDEPIRPEQIKGVLLYSVPFVGHFTRNS